ncbi:MAG: hypothetical protein JXA60_10330 [Candidatus Coatesbacteria bacterium]|nr:hypothetical protein [Candidatus Coatesbacteria bacterium]
MKPYKKPEIISEQVLEKTALNCEEYLYYTKNYEGCREEMLGRGKEDAGCAGLYLYT